ncbi:hypothetical protein L6452_36939 [Arctium lappa]|uniref:Uncharacterized protein n=1 Tax=Arctium lappa TaxID=4217 RepID=A0ACB8Y0V9_ARCLA|nr:hypothetical protein L6452_36939 [Arctium lappa]
MKLVRICPNVKPNFASYLLHQRMSGKVWHCRTFQPSGLFAAWVDMQGSSPGLHALFTGEDDTWDAWLNVGTSGFAPSDSKPTHRDANQD